MLSPSRRARIACALAASALLAGAPAANAGHETQVPPDLSKMDYAYKNGTTSVDPGFFKIGAPVPLANACVSSSSNIRQAMSGKRFNPSGKYLAFDNNVFEVLCLPFRGAGDQKADDPYGNERPGAAPEPRHGFCSQPGTPNPDAPLQEAAGTCPNHQLEYIDYYETTMKDILRDFGVTTHRYEFQNVSPADNTYDGRAINPAAIVPGASHPEETIVIGAHYDQTTEGPASAWDSAEGHAQMIRVAKLMADYWKATNSRPAATVKFIPWDAEESGTFGSRDYTEKNIVPGEESKVRGYWNTDPCAGGYPAYRNGNPADRVDLGIQLGRPEEIPDQFNRQRPAMRVFNAKAIDVVEDVFNRIDDTVPGAQGETFLSKLESPGGYDYRPGGDVQLGGARPVLFSSDWANFLNKGVPFFNPGPEITGPSDQNDPNNPDGLAILHTPNDNIVTLNKYTDQGPGATFSAGWAKGMEMCAHLLAWGMLRSDQGGAMAVDDNVVAYYEALPNEAGVKVPVNFDAAGTHRNVGGTTNEDDLEYTWDFGDRTSGTGKTISHAYEEPGRYVSKLTVRHKPTGKTDTMTVPITVVDAIIAGPPAEAPGEDADGNFPVTWKFDEKARPGFLRYRLEEANDVRTVLNDPAENLDAGWVASEPTNPNISKWQHSDSPTAGSVRGNIKQSGARSFYSGVPRSNQQPRTGPSSGVSRLTSKGSYRLSKDAELTYFSSYANDNNDRGRVEVAIALPGVGDEELDWSTVDTIATATSYSIPTAEATYPKTLTLRRADLSGYAGQQVKLRFVYGLGPAQFVNVYRTGWYVDDIKVDTGTFRAIAEPTGQKFDVSGRTAGVYTYRVRGVFSDVATRGGTPATTRVTVGAPGTPGGGGPGTNPGGNPGGVPSSCVAVNGYRSLRIIPSKRGLKVTFARSSNATGPVNVSVFRQSVGRRVAGNRLIKAFPRRTKSFSWDGRAKKGVGPGYYFIRVTVPVGRGQFDVRRVALVRRNGRFALRPSFYRRGSCGTIESFKLERTVFGGRDNRALQIAYRLTREARVTVEVRRGRRTVKTFKASNRVSNRTHRLRLASEKLKRGDYSIRITAVADGKRTVATLTARRL